MAEQTAIPDIPALDCTTDSECTNITQSVCDTVKNVCHCTDELSILVKTPLLCTRPANLNTTCKYEEQCLAADGRSTCDQVSKICGCKEGYELRDFTGVGVSCSPLEKSAAPDALDPAMIGMLAALVLMFVIICVVMRLFSKARFRENRSIFNTPNPRLMNASLFKDSKLLSPARGERRGSRASCKGSSSRAGSVTSVAGARRPSNTSTCPKGRRGSTISTASGTGSLALGREGAVPGKSPTHSTKEQPKETAVAIEAVD